MAYVDDEDMRWRERRYWNRKARKANVDRLYGAPKKRRGTFRGLLGF